MNVIVKKQPVDHSLEAFLKQYRIRLWLEDNMEDSSVSVIVRTKPWISTRSEVTSHGLCAHKGMGRYADFAMRAFLKSIVGKEIVLESKHSFICPPITWDGILRVPIKKQGSKKKVSKP